MMPVLAPCPSRRIASKRGSCLPFSPETCRFLSWSLVSSVFSHGVDLSRFELYFDGLTRNIQKHNPWARLGCFGLGLGAYTHEPQTQTTLSGHCSRDSARERAERIFYRMRSVEA